jgi:type III secretion protein X
MAVTINLLDPSLGIQNVMEMPSPDSLPRARELASNALNEAGLEELYAPDNARHCVEQALCPEVGDGSILNPQQFSALLHDSLNNLSDMDDPAVRELVSRELTPLLQNEQLLQAYVGLMIGG